MKVDRNQLLIYGIVFFLGAITAVAGMILTRQSRPAPLLIMPPPPTATAAPTTTPKATATPAPLNVYVSGEVQTPGVYRMPPGSLVADAVAAAGGFKSEAAGDMINLAIALYEGMHIFVPPETAMIDSPPLPSVNQTISEPDQPLTPQFPININTADEAQLQQLPGIGPGMAERIVAYRLENGRFDTVEAIMQVSGIGDGKYKQIAALIIVEE